MKTGVRMKIAAVLLGLLPLLGACGLDLTPRFLEAYLRSPRRSLTDYVRLLEGKSDAERRKTLERILRVRGIEYEVEGYEAGGEAGANLVFELGAGGHELIVSAHSDAVPGSPGANDDASCVAAILRAYERLRAVRLESLKVRFVIFDDEESGLKGSGAYVRRHPLNRVVAMFSLELCGIGDTIAVWDSKKDERETPGIGALIQALRQTRLGDVVEGRIPRYGSDHRKFAEAGIPAVGLTVIPKRDEAVLREYIFRPKSPKWADRKNRPTIFQTYHSPGDSVETLEEAAMRRMADVLYEAVLRLNRRLRPSTGVNAG